MYFEDLEQVHERARLCASGAFEVTTLHMARQEHTVLVLPYNAKFDDDRYLSCMHHAIVHAMFGKFGEFLQTRQFTKLKPKQNFPLYMVHSPEQIQ